MGYRSIFKEEEDEKKAIKETSYRSIFGNEYEKAQVKVEEVREEVKQEKKVSWLDKFGSFQKDLGIVSRAIKRKFVDTGRELPQVETPLGAIEKTAEAATKFIPKFGEGFAPKGKEDLPFGGTLFEAGDVGKLLLVDKKIKDKTASNREKIWMNNYLKEAEAEEKKREDIGYRMGSGIKGSGIFMVELGAAALLAAPSGGSSVAAFAGAKLSQKKAKDIIKDFVKDKATRRLLVDVGKKQIKRTGTEVAIVGGLHTPQGALERMVGTPEFKEGGEFIGLAEDGQDVGEAIINSATDNIVEVVSERTGGLFSLFGGSVKNSLVKAGILKATKNINKNLSEKQIANVFKIAGWNGIINEYLEERVGDVMRGALEKVGLNDWEFRLPTLAQSAEEIATFAIMGSAIKTVEKGVGGLSRMLPTPAREMPLSDELKEIKEEKEEVVSKALEARKLRLEKEGYIKPTPKPTPLITEARKYKSAEEFYQKMPSKIRDEFRNKNIKGKEQIENWFNKSITPKKPILDNLNPTGSLYVDYTPQSRMTMKLGENITTLDKTSGKSADEIITIYRGAPKIQKEIVAGDFITTNYDLAKSYAGEGNVLQKKVKMSDVLDDITEPLGEEYIYRPIKAKTLPQVKPIVKSKAEEVGLPKKKEEVRIMKPSKAKTGKEVVKELLERGMDIRKGTAIIGKYPRPLIGKVELKTLFKNSDEFKKKPILIVNAEKNLEFKGEKTEFTIKPEALNFKKENLVVGEKILVDEKALKEKGAQMQMRVPMRKSVSDKLKILQKELDEITDGKNPQSVMDELQESIAKPKTTDTQKEKYQKTIDVIKKLLKEISEIQPGLTIQDITKLDEKERIKIEKTVDDIISEDTETKEEYEKMKDVWFGDKDERILETQTEKRLLQRKLKQVLGQKKYNDKVRDIDKAIHIYIDTKHNPAHIKEYWDKLNKEQQKIVTLSQNLPDNVQKIADIISEEYENIGLEALDQEVVHNVLDNYVGRIWDLGGEYKADQSSRKFGTTTRHAKARKLETIIEGWAKGMNLRVEGATGNLEILKTEIIKTIEDKRFIKLLKGLKTYDNNPFLTSKLHIKKNGERVSLDGYVEVKHPNFVGWEWAGKAEEGEAYGNNFFITEEGDIMEKRRLYAPKEYADNLNNILGVSTLMEHASIRIITKYNAIIKAWILQSSFFHHLAFARSYYLGTHGKTLKEMNIVTAYKDGIKSIEELEPTVRLLVRNGLTLGIRQDWEESFLQEKTSIGKILDKTEATKQTKDFILKLRQDQADFLFGEFGAGLKAKSGLIEFRNLQKKYPNKDVNEVAKMAANLINDDFGGLHLGRMGRNPTLQHIFRLFALAPDWTESNIRSMVKAINYKTPTAERAMYQRFWAGILTKGMLLTVIANFLLSFFDDKDFWERYKIAWESGRLHWLDVDITPIYRLFGGKSKDRRYFSIFGHFKDPFKFILHPIRSAHYKGSVVYGFFHEALSGTDWSGRKFTTYKEFLGMEGTKKDPSKYKGQTVKYGIGRPIGIEQIPSFLLGQLIGSQPVQVQNLIGWHSGEMDGFDAMAKSMGLNTSRTYTKEKSLREKELIKAVEKWESGDRSFMIRRKIEKELIDSVYSETYSEGKKPSKSSTSNLRKDFRIYAEFGFENEIVNEIMHTQLNEDKVDILLKAKKEMEEFDEFYKKAKKVNLLSDDVRKQFFKSQR